MQKNCFGAVFVTVILLTGCSGSDSSAQQQAVSTSGPAGKSSDPAKLEGLAYNDARAMILGDGWKPASQECSGGGTSPETCEQYPEISNCSGSGPGFCDMSFGKSGQCMTVVTTGGPPQRGNNGDTFVDGVQVTPKDCSVEGTDLNQTDASQGSSRFAAFAQPICKKLQSQGISNTVEIDEFIPGFPAALTDPARAEGETLTHSDMTDLVRGLACGAGLSGFGPDVPETALGLFESKRHGKAAMAALREMSAKASGVEGKAAKEFLDQMTSYLQPPQE
jgi:hypothetical protein